MTTSREELVLLALRWRGIPGAGQTPAAEDKAAMDQVLPKVMDNLAQRNIYVWGDPDQIDDAAAVPLSALVAWRAFDLGNMVPGAPTVDQAETELRELKPYIDAGDPIPALYF